MQNVLLYDKTNHPMIITLFSVVPSLSRTSTKSIGIAMYGKRATTNASACHHLKRNFDFGDDGSYTSDTSGNSSSETSFNRRCSILRKQHYGRRCSCLWCKFFARYCVADCTAALRSWIGYQNCTDSIEATLTSSPVQLHQRESNASTIEFWWSERRIYMIIPKISR